MPDAIPEQFPTHPKQLSAGWLSARLREQGVLPVGAVSALRVEPGEKWNLAHTARVVVEYDIDTAAPRQLFVKIAEPHEILDHLYPGEYAFYTEVQTPDLPLATCYGAFRDPDSRRTCILLEDLGATHAQIPWPGFPELAMCEAAVAALARIHGHWWREGAAQPHELGRSLQAHEHQLADYVLDLLPGFFAACGNRLSDKQRTLMRDVCEKLPGLKIARLSGAPVTRIHGDPHFWNFLYPRDPARHGCVLIDWEDWRDDSCGSDLAMMIALHWDEAHRSQHQDRLLRHYLAVLGRRDYSFDDLFGDYRLGHLQNVVVPVFQWHMGHSIDNSVGYLARWFTAFDDLGCEVLL